LNKFVLALLRVSVSELLI